MIFPNNGFATVCIVCGLLLTSCAQSRIDTSWQQKLEDCPTSMDLGKFSPLDRLEIRVPGQKDMSGEYEVSSRGTLNFPIIGEIQAAGRRCDELEDIIGDALRRNYLRDPSVVCINREIAKTAVTVDGQVQKPGVIEFRPGLMLTDVIAQAGGPTQRAKRDIVIVRKMGDRTESVTVPYGDILVGDAPNVCLHPSDLVYVPQSVF